MIRGDGIHTITFNGNGFTIDADDTGRVFFVESGKVNDQRRDHRQRHGARREWRRRSGGGSGGGGGGLGAGAAVFVNSGAVVTLTDVALRMRRPWAARAARATR